MRIETAVKFETTASADLSLHSMTTINLFITYLFITYNNLFITYLFQTYLHVCNKYENQVNEKPVGFTHLRLHLSNTFQQQVFQNSGYNFC